MKQLLNSSTYRRIQFVEFLDQLPSWCDVKEAARKIDCSAKTLLSDIDYINEFWGDYIYIEYSKFQGVRLNNITSNKMGIVNQTNFNLLKKCCMNQIRMRIIGSTNCL